jgi:hypothetical protein
MSTRSLLAVCKQVKGIFLYPVSNRDASAVEQSST